MSNLSPVVDVDQPERSIDSPEYQAAFHKFCEAYGRDDVLSVSDALLDCQRVTLRAKKGLELLKVLKGGAK